MTPTFLLWILLNYKQCYRFTTATIWSILPCFFQTLPLPAKSQKRLHYAIFHHNPSWVHHLLHCRGPLDTRAFSRRNPDPYKICGKAVAHSLFVPSVPGNVWNAPIPLLPLNVFRFVLFRSLNPIKQNSNIVCCLIVSWDWPPTTVDAYASAIPEVQKYEDSVYLVQDGCVEVACVDSVGIWSCSASSNSSFVCTPESTCIIYLTRWMSFIRLIRIVHTGLIWIGLSTLFLNSKCLSNWYGTILFTGFS